MYDCEHCRQSILSLCVITLPDVRDSHWADSSVSERNVNAQITIPKAPRKTRTIELVIKTQKQSEWLMVISRMQKTIPMKGVNSRRSCIPSLTPKGSIVYKTWVQYAFFLLTFESDYWEVGTCPRTWNCICAGSGRGLVCWQQMVDCSEMWSSICWLLSLRPQRHLKYTTKEELQVKVVFDGNFFCWPGVCKIFSVRHSVS